MNEENTNGGGENPVEIESSVALSPDAQTIDVQIATARRYPRSIKAFMDSALSMATIDQSTAESCFYVLTRKDKDGEVKSIEGPGVRLAEICAAAWGNLRFGSRIVGEDDKFVTAQGMAFDLQNNVAMTIEVRRRITNKHGRRYSDDMVAVTANAASAIALRNAIFRVIPKAFIDPIYKAAKKVAVGTAETLDARRRKLLDRFAKMGVGQERIMTSMGLKGLADIDLEMMEKLIGLGTAIKDGEITIETAFPVATQAEAGTKTDSIAAKLKSKIEQESGANG